MDEKGFPMNEEGISEDETPVEIIEDGDRQDSASPYDMALLTDEETGEQWCTIKYAAKLTGLSYSTIRRYTKDGRLTVRTEDSPFGKVNYVSMTEIEEFKSVYDLEKAKRGVRVGDYKFEMASFVKSSVAPAINELTESVGRLETSQAELMSQMSAGEQARAEQMDEIRAQNEALMAKLSEMSEIIARQDEAITELKAAADKAGKGFWSRLFGK